ncbi:glycosyltransferase family 4 protein [Ideonella sp. DXS22W]|uniref:Glycosyltransferase family 4 protein n=1 Tax=Pseudaquabacterium inlustre TaxID=2984192 RepID=A0ABU9CHP1_9BURK
MRLLVVSQYFWPESFRVNELVAQLVARGHTVTVLTGRPNYPSGDILAEYREDPRRFARFEGASVLRVPLRPRGKGSLRLVLNYWSFVFWGCLLGPWLTRGQRYDAIFCFETSPITSALPALLLRRIKHAPLALWVLDLWPDTLSAVGVVRSERGLAMVGALVSFIYRRCDLILAQSRAFFEPIQRWSGAPDKTRYFPQWAEGVFGEAVAAPPAPELAAHAHAFRLMFAGNLGDAQDFPSILAAAAQLRHRTDIHWLIVGDGRALDQIRSDIDRLQLHDTVFLLGRYPLERMPAFFAGADALLVSLKKEPIFAMTVPGKVQSYLAAGRPIVAMLDGEGAHVVAESGAGLTCPAGDSIALSRCVENMAGLPADERARMSAAGIAYAKRVFDRDQLLDTLEDWLAPGHTSADHERRPD